MYDTLTRRWLTAEWLDGMEFDAFDSGRNWNGWAFPLMTRSQLESLIPKFNTVAGFASMRLLEDGRLIMEEVDGVDIISPTKTHGMELYDVSLGLCWDWAE